MMRGDGGATPDLTVTSGTVNTEQSMVAPDGAAVSLVVHSAPISQGNSGGPLVDMCGRIVGVNTFVRRGQLRNLNVALASPDLLAFLAGSAAQPAVVTTPCRPQVTRPAPPPPAAE
jgi:S1-C subfamily serine protease